MIMYIWLYNIFLSLKFQKNYVSENNIDVNIIVEMTENDQCAHGYPNKLL